MPQNRLQPPHFTLPPATKSPTGKILCGVVCERGREKRLDVNSRKIKSLPLARRNFAHAAEFICRAILHAFKRGRWCIYRSRKPKTKNLKQRGNATASKHKSAKRRKKTRRKAGAKHQCQIVLHFVFYPEFFDYEFVVWIVGLEVAVKSRLYRHSHIAGRPLVMHHFSDDYFCYLL